MTVNTTSTEKILKQQTQQVFPKMIGFLFLLELQMSEIMNLILWFQDILLLIIGLFGMPTESKISEYITMFMLSSLEIFHRQWLFKIKKNTAF